MPSLKNVYTNKFQNLKFECLKETIGSFLEYKNFLLTKLIEFKYDFNILFSDSSIVSNVNEKCLLSKWLSCVGNVKETKRLYKATRDGDMKEKFHELCDEKGATLSLFKTKEGNIFGGFTIRSWKSIEGYKRDDKAFVFNLNEKKMYKVRRPDEAIYTSNDYLQIFGNTTSLGDTFN